MNKTRRIAIQKLLFGAGYIGLRALATGIPAHILLAAEQGRALEPSPSSKLARSPQYVLFSTTGLGDPINANVPGTYDDPNIIHSTDPSMAATQFTVGGSQVKAAQIWSTLPATTLAQTNFFHHGTFTEVHPDITDCLKLQGALKDGEMLPSLMAQQLGQTFQSTLMNPVNFSREFVTSRGSLQQNLTPQSLAASLSAPGSGLGDVKLLAMRDQTVDSVNKWARARGKQYQQDFIDQYALSQNQVRAMQQKIVAQLSNMTNNEAPAQIAASLLLFKLNVAPVTVIYLPFGLDNHNDQNFATLEVPQHKSSIGILATLEQSIADAGLQDQVTFCTHAVFGRQLGIGATNNGMGRNHQSGHATSLIIGKNVRGGVTGGLKRNTAAADSPYSARGIDSASGTSNDAGDVPFADTFGALGKTMLAAVGIDETVIDMKIQRGKVVTGALA